MSKIAFVFPGQGSQNVGMGKDLYDNFKEAKEIYEKACDILDLDIIKLCFEGPLEELTKTENAQPAILTTSIAANALLEKKNITMDMAAGHSLGEYSAYVAAGWISFEDGLKAVRERGLAMAGADPEGKGSMAAIIGLDADVVKMICKEASKQGVVVPANYNTPNQIVISGEKSGIVRAIELAEEKDATMAKELVVSGAFHSPLMEGALERFKKAIDSIEIKDGKCPVIANVSADVVDKDKIKDSLIEQMTSSVLWVDSVNKMQEMGAETFIEVGSGKVLRGLIKKINRKLDVLSVGDSSSLEKTLEKLKS
jgi:[acyl-carrier-protein] S-malonyltransferase